MAPRKKNAKKRSAAAPAEPNKHVYVVTRIIQDHAMCYGSGPERKIMGIYATKDIAAREAGSMDSYTLGTFEEALKEYRNNCDYYDEDEECPGHIDNRRNPPSSGILMKAGHEDEGEGDYVALEIETFPLIQSTKLQISEPSKKRKTNNDDEGGSDDDRGFIF